jgi:peptide chain release factor subunit 1
MATSGQLTTVDSRIRKLAAIRTDEPRVISVYVSLDPGEFPTRKERRSEIESLMDEAATKVDDDALSHDGRNALARDISKVRDWAETSLDPDGAKGVAVFCSSPIDLFEVFKLARPVAPEVRVDHAPYLEPLIATLPHDAWCVFVVNRADAKIFRGTRDHLTDVERIQDDVHQQHDQGGWSQARYQRSVEKEVSDHVKNACDHLFEEFRIAPFDKLLIACPQERWPEVEEKLHSYLKERLVEQFDADILGDGPDDVLERCRPLIEQHERRQEAALIERLAEGLGQNDRAASGLAPVLEALHMRRVETLLIDADFHAAGVVCRQCGWMAPQGKNCPFDKTPVDRVDDIIEAAVEAAVLQSAAVHEVRYHEPDRALGGSIAALLRF